MKNKDTLCIYGTSRKLQSILNTQTSEILFCFGFLILDQMSLDASAYCERLCHYMFQ